MHVIADPANRWATAAGQPRRTVLQAHPNKGRPQTFTLADISEDGQYVVAALRTEENGTVTAHAHGAMALWAVRNRRVVRWWTNKAHGKKRITALRFVADGTKILSGGEDGVVRLWSTGLSRESDLDPQVPLATFKCRGAVCSVAAAFSQDPALIVAGADGGTVSAWSSQGGPPLLVRSMVADRVMQPKSVCVSPDASWAAACSPEGSIRAWDISSKEDLLAELSSGSAIPIACFATEETLAVCDKNGSLRFWQRDRSLREGAPGAGSRLVEGARAVQLAQDSACTCAASSHDLSLFAMEVGSGTVRLYGRDGRCIRELYGLGSDRERVKSIAVSQDANSIVACYERRLVVWSLQGGAEAGPASPPPVDCQAPPVERQAAAGAAGPPAAPLDRFLATLQEAAAGAAAAQREIAELRERAGRAEQAERELEEARQRAERAEAARAREAEGLQRRLAASEARAGEAEGRAGRLAAQLETAVQLSEGHLAGLSAAQLRELSERLAREVRRVDDLRTEAALREAQAAAQQRAAAAKAEEEKQCVVCLESLASRPQMAVIPCGHAKLCETCATNLLSKQDPCPECRSPIMNCMRVFT